MKKWLILAVAVLIIPIIRGDAQFNPDRTIDDAPIASKPSLEFKDLPKYLDINNPRLSSIELNVAPEINSIETVIQINRVPTWLRKTAIRQGKENIIKIDLRDVEWPDHIEMPATLEIACTSDTGQTIKATIGFYNSEYSIDYEKTYAINSFMSEMRYKGNVSTCGMYNELIIVVYKDGKMQLITLDYGKSKQYNKVMFSPICGIDPGESRFIGITEMRHGSVYSREYDLSYVFMFHGKDGFRAFRIGVPMPGFSDRSSDSPIEVSGYMKLSEEPLKVIFEDKEIIVVGGSGGRHIIDKKELMPLLSSGMSMDYNFILCNNAKGAVCFVELRHDGDIEINCRNWNSDSRIWKDYWNEHKVIGSDIVVIHHPGYDIGNREKPITQSRAYRINWSTGKRLWEIKTEKGYYFDFSEDSIVKYDSKGTVKAKYSFETGKKK